MFIGYSGVHMITPLLALLITGQAATQATAGATSLQGRFDAATAAAEAGKCADAIREFEAVEATGAQRRNPLLAASIDVRKGRCLIQMGRFAEGEAAIRRGLPVLSGKPAEFGGDITDSHLALGSAARARFDYDAAAREFQAAVDLTQGAQRVIPLLRLSQVLMFDRDGRALAAAEEARTLTMTSPQFSKRDIASVQTQYARVLLNEGRPKEAYKELKDSLAKQGGLGSKVSMADIATRSDLAIAALQNRDLDGARLYLAYTGAGRMRDTPFSQAAVMDPPVCGGEGGLAPDDHAIVEFTLEEDGRVSGVAPIYTTGKRAAALAFARAVGEWSWRAEAAKKIPILFRYTTRVELRCVKAPEAPGLTEPLEETVETWLQAKTGGRPAWDEMSAAAALPLQEASLLKAQAAKDQAGILQAALALADSPVTDAEKTKASLATARAAAEALGAPAPVRSYIALRQQQVQVEGGPDAYRKSLRALLAEPAVLGDPLSASTIRLLVAQRMGKSKPPADANMMLDAVVNEPGLPARHPLKVAGMLAQANVLAAAGNLPGARAVFDQTGLSAEQCASLGLQPAMKRSGASDSDYPMAAMQLGFEGWVRTEYDIAADGRTVAPRAVIAYPPFIFDEAATGILRDTRYTSTFRPEGALACSGEQQSITFRLP
ncbi:MAG TPA: energy transducer TonB [Allosphingosinicella sp.]|jgi:tetratricopeptide (TPR) repeat protein